MEEPRTGRGTGAGDAVATLSMHHSRQAAWQQPPRCRSPGTEATGMRREPCLRPTTNSRVGFGWGPSQVRVTWDPRCPEHKATGAVQEGTGNGNTAAERARRSWACGRRSVWSPAFHVKEALSEGGGSRCDGRLFNHGLRPVSLPVSMAQQKPSVCPGQAPRQPDPASASAPEARPACSGRSGCAHPTHRPQSLPQLAPGEHILVQRGRPQRPSRPESKQPVRAQERARKPQCAPRTPCCSWCGLAHLALREHKRPRQRNVRLLLQAAESSVKIHEFSAARLSRHVVATGGPCDQQAPPAPGQTACARTPACASTVLVSVHRSGFPQLTDVCSCRGNDSRLAHRWPHTCHYRDVNNLDLPGNLHPTNPITARCSPVQEKGTLCWHAHFIFSPAGASVRQRAGRFLAASTLPGHSPVTIPPRAASGFCEPWKAPHPTAPS